MSQPPRADLVRVRVRAKGSGSGSGSDCRAAPGVYAAICRLASGSSRAGAGCTRVQVRVRARSPGTRSDEQHLPAAVPPIDAGSKRWPRPQSRAWPCMAVSGGVLTAMALTALQLTPHALQAGYPQELGLGLGLELGLDLGVGLGLGSG
eukprot:scaffold40601_cov55-Phaeocystis_antarctica.AAC.1